MKYPARTRAVLLTALVLVLIPGERLSSQAAAQQGEASRSQPAAAQTTLAPHASTQWPANLVTAARMTKWEKELSNWGRWGPKDQRGTLNLITPQKTLAAARLVKAGVSVSLYRFPDLEKAIDTGNMNADTKHWMTSVDPKTGQVRGALDAISFAVHDGGHTHIDALCHYAVQSDREHPLVFNGHPQSLDQKGCKADAIDQMGGGYVTRGILIDLPLLRGVEWLEARPPIYIADLEAWEKFASVRIGSGDAIFIRTGRWARRAKTGPWNAAREIAGLHASVLPWLRQRDVALISGEGVPDVQPSGVEDWPRPIHDIAIPIMGTPLVDNGYFEDLAPLAARLKRWEFMVSWTIMPIPNGTASPFMGLATF